jgi:2-haloalkanoic acid dehalogenase type II
MLASDRKVIKERKHMTLSHLPQWITFDCYGTLIDTRAGYVPLFADLIAEKGAASRIDTQDVVNAWGEEEFRLIQGPYRKYRDILKESVENTLKQFGLPVASGDGERLANAWGTFQPYADVYPILSQLQRRYKLALISNVDDDILTQSVASIGIDFDGLYTAQQSGAYKPSEVPFRYALERMGVAPADVLHVAFGWRYDLPAAVKLGMLTLWVNRRKLTLPPDAVMSDLVMTDLAEVPRLLGL